MKRIAFAASLAIACGSLVAGTGCGDGSLQQTIGTVGDTMAYDVTTLIAKPGQKVHITLVNHGKQPAMIHNFVLTQPGKEKDVAEAGLAAGEGSGFLKAGDPNVIVASPQSKPGQTVEVTFNAPTAPGSYPYICTYPGHYLTMRGILTVR